MRILITLALIFVPFFSCAASVITVEADGSGDRPTIQAAINAASDGDSVVLGRGVYRGEGNRDLEPGGKRITIRSADPTEPNCVENTVIDCEGSEDEWHCGFHLRIEDGPEAIISGLTIQGGYQDTGGAIDLWESAASIQNCIFKDNMAVDGGAIYCNHSWPNISNCIMTQNEATQSGGAVFYVGVTEETSPTMTNCLLVDNAAVRDGGAISITWLARPVFSNCTIYGNRVSAEGIGGGVYCGSESQASIVNSIIRANDAGVGRQVAVARGFNELTYTAELSVWYCAFEDGGDDPNMLEEEGCVLYRGDGNITDDPLFVAGPYGEFYLSQKAAGENVDSPCLDAGNASSAELDMNKYTTRSDSWFDVYDRGIVDMGYHYRLPEWKIDCRYCDLHLDGVIDLADVAMIGQRWLDVCSEPIWCGGTDINFDGRVGLLDVSIVAKCWLVADEEPPQPETAQWDIEPRVTGLEGNAVEMSAMPVVDEWLGDGVEYCFQCMNDSSQSSGWQQNYDPSDTATYRARPEYYLNSGLKMDTLYSYKLRIRDRRGNLGRDSGIVYVRTASELDPPTPNPSVWAMLPYATGGSSVKMTAATSTDVNGPVQYYFRYTDPNGVHDGEGDGHDSGWQNSPVYEDQDLTDGEYYYYRVRTRDKYGNETQESPLAWAKADSTIFDFTPPQPNPPVWPPKYGAIKAIEQREVNGSWWHHLTIQPVDDPQDNGVEYYFWCFDFPKFSSDWQSVDNPSYDPWGIPAAPNEYWVFVGAEDMDWNYLVKARDRSANQNESSEWSASIRLSQL